MKYLFLIIIALSLCGTATAQDQAEQIRQINLRLDVFKATHNAGVFGMALGGAAIAASELSRKPSKGVTTLGICMASIGATFVLYAPNRLRR